MLYSKNGSIPKTETDGTEGWVEVPEPPVAPEGMEVVWWCPPGWVVRPIKPVKEGFDYNWSQSEEKWVEYALPSVLTEEPLVVSTSYNDVITTSASISDSFSIGTTGDSITIDITPSASAGSV